jgi:putative OPT family oligopeptide transporter
MKDEKISDLTVKSLVVGVILSLIMAAANTYLGLKAGLTISANIPCSVIAIILFHTLLRARSSAEVNVAQSTGSVGEGLVAGAVFVFPALALSGVFPSFAKWGWKEYVIVTLAVLSGAILGVVLTGFLRRPMVEESKELKYPEGVATAEIIKTGMATFGTGKEAGLLGLGAAFFGGMLVKICSGAVAIFEGTVSVAFRAGNSVFKLGGDISAALVGVGFIIEFNGAFLMVLGGVLGWLVFVPILSSIYPTAGAPGEVAEKVWEDSVRFIGVGGMIVGGIWSIFQIKRQLIEGIKSVLSGLSGTSPTSSREVDLSRTSIWVLILLGIALSAASYFAIVGIVGASIATVYTILAVFFFVAISVYIVGLIGSTNQPVSGITICTFLLAAIFIFAGRVTGAEAVKTIILISGVVCLAACLSGTAAQNFKTAMIVGGSPKAIQTGLIAAVVLTSFLVVPFLTFLDKAFGIGSKALGAPQANMFAAMAKGLFVEGAPMPWDMVAIGVGLGVLLILLGALLKWLGSSFTISPMAVAVGIYLPFTTTLPILLGGIIHLLVTRKSQGETDLNEKIQKGTVLCAGLVAGEAITGIITAIFIGIGLKLPLPGISSDLIRTILSVAVLLALPVLVYLGIRKSTTRTAR